MLINARFTEAIHILCLITIKDNKINTSNRLAASINTNPVVIRRIFKLLKDANLIITKRGSKGCTLSKEPNQISLKDIYYAVENKENRQIFRFHENNNCDCLVGSNIENVLGPKFNHVQQQMENELNKTTLEDIINELKFNQS